MTTHHGHVTVQWLFQNSLLLETYKNVVWQSADGRVTSDHCHVTVQWLFFKILPNCWKRRKNVVWQSADGRLTSDYCRVTIQRLFLEILPIAWYVDKQLFDSRPTVASPPTWLELQKRCCLKVSGLSRDGPATLFLCFFRAAPNPLCLADVCLVYLFIFIARPMLKSGIFMVSIFVQYGLNAKHKSMGRLKLFLSNNIIRISLVSLILIL